MADDTKEDAGEPELELEPWEIEALGKLEIERRAMMTELLAMSGEDPERMGVAARRAGLQVRRWNVASAIAGLEGDRDEARGASHTAQKWQGEFYRARKSDADDVLDTMEEALRTRKLVA